MHITIPANRGELLSDTRIDLASWPHSFGGVGSGTRRQHTLIVPVCTHLLRRAVRQFAKKFCQGILLAGDAAYSDSV